MVGSVPVRYAWFILVVVIGTTLVSLYFVDVMRQNMTGSESAPEDVESIKRLAQYSEQFDSGQTGVIILRADENRLDRAS